MKTSSWMIILLIVISLVIGGFLTFYFNASGQIQSGGRSRSYLLYVPDSYDAEKPNPLVISIHGFAQWPAHQQWLSGWNRLADENGFLVVYPRGTGFPLRWQVGPLEEDREKTQQEVEFFDDLIDHLGQTYNIDQNRIYVNGMSNGGGMTHLLACQLPDRFAAFGSVAGAYLYPGDCDQLPKEVPWIAFHGLDDPIVPFQGGETRHQQQGIKFPAIEFWIAAWAEVNGCDLNPEREKITPEVTRIGYSGCLQNIELVLYRIAGAGHTWPGGGWLPVWLTGKTNRDINATKLMWDFFQETTLHE